MWVSGLWLKIGEPQNNILATFQWVLLKIALLGVFSCPSQERKVYIVYPQEGEKRLKGALFSHF